MKTILFIIMALLLSTLTMAQESDDLNNPPVKEKKTRKELRAEKTEAEYRITKGMIDSMQFVLEADWLGNQTGNRVPVNSSLNFIRVDSSEAVIQTGSNYALGRNGLGGTTATGRISNYVADNNDSKHSIRLRFEVMTSIGFYSITMDVMANGRTTATLSGNLRGKLNFYGQLVPLDESNSFKGSSL